MYTTTFFLNINLSINITDGFFDLKNNEELTVWKTLHGRLTPYRNAELKRENIWNIEHKIVFETSLKVLIVAWVERSKQGVRKLHGWKLTLRPHNTPLWSATQHYVPSTLLHGLPVYNSPDHSSSVHSSHYNSSPVHRSPDHMSPDYNSPIHRSQAHNSPVHMLPIKSNIFPKQDALIVSNSSVSREVRGQA